MPHRRRPRARAGESGFDGSGFPWDVWLPAAVALVAALFMLGLAQAADAPRPIYDAARFAPASVAAETASYAPRADLSARPVAVAALSDLSPRAAPSSARPVTIAAPSSRADSGSGRALAAALIALMLAMVLSALARHWRRTEPLLAAAPQATAR